MGNCDPLRDVERDLVVLAAKRDYLRTRMRRVILASVVLLGGFVCANAFWSLHGKQPASIFTTVFYPILGILLFFLGQQIRGYSDALLEVELTLVEREHQRGRLCREMVCLDTPK